MSCLGRDSGGGRVRQDTEMASCCYLARLFCHMSGEGRKMKGTRIWEWVLSRKVFFLFHQPEALSGVKQTTA